MHLSRTIAAAQNAHAPRVCPRARAQRNGMLLVMINGIILYKGCCTKVSVSMYGVMYKESDLQ